MGGRGGSVGKFLQRAAISIILITVVTAVIYVFPDWLFCVVIALLVGAGQYEFFRMVEKKGVFVYKYFGTITGSLIPVVIFLGAGLSDLKNLEPILIVVASLFAFTMQFMRKDSARDHLMSMALTLFSLLYIGWFFSFFMKIKLLPNGADLVAFLVIVTKSADIGAYVIGSMIGKNELIPRISPKKTKEGTIGGILFSLSVAFVVGRFLTGFSTVHLLVLGGLLAVIGQVGDLAESLIKRDCGVKDSGTYLWGIGGALDLIDSLLFTAPVFYFYVRTF
jgi:phosphatidate cytidylyltransferase